MRNLLKYLFPLFVIMAFCNATGRSDSPATNIPVQTCQLEETSVRESFSRAESDIRLPRTSSLSSSARPQVNLRRAGNTHSRSAHEFMKSGRTLNSYISYSYQRYSIVISTSVIEHAQKLVFLGKLII